MPRYLLTIILLIYVVSLISLGGEYGPKTSTWSLSEIKSAVEKDLDLGNSNVEQTAVTIAKDYPGEYNMNQVCEIFNTLRKGWFYLSDPSNTNKYKNANRTLQDGKISDTIGMGNCDDFAILMSSLIASLGGSTRITFASNMSSTEGHAYCEVFLGLENDSQVDELINWIKAEYNLPEVPGLNTTRNEVWLNLDWWANHPGGPYVEEGEQKTIVWQSDKLTSPKIIPIIDTMDSVSGWRALKDDKGSEISIEPGPAKKGMGIAISYDLKKGGFVGISRDILTDALSFVAGLNFSCYVADNPVTVELLLISINGTKYTYSWKPDQEKWEYLQALFEDFNCLDTDSKSASSEDKLDPSSINRMEIIISCPDDQAGSGKVIADHIRGLMNIPAGSPWARAEIQRMRADALDAEADSEKASTSDFGIINAAEMDIKSLKSLQTPTGLQKTIQDLNLLPEPFARMAHNGSVNYATFSPDGKRIATASDDCTARIWDAETGQQMAIIKHVGKVLSVVFSPDGAEVVTASADGTARIWDCRSSRQLFSLNHNGTVVSAAFSPDGTKIATASSDTTARLWDAQTGKLLAILKHGGPVLSAVFSPDGGRLATASMNEGAWIWDLKIGSMLAKIDDTSVQNVAFSPDGTKLATTSLLELAKLWDAQTGMFLNVMKSDSSVSILAFSPDGKKIAAACNDGNVKLFDVSTGNQLAMMKEKLVLSIVFSPDGSEIATTSSDHTAIIWNADTGEKMKIMLHQGPVLSMAFSPDRTRIVTSSQDHSAMIWDMDAPEQLAVMRHDSPVYSVAYSHDATRIATTSFEATSSIAIWDARTGEQLLRISQPSSIWAVAFSPDDKSLATSANYLNNTSIWDTETGQLLVTMKDGDPDRLSLSVVFSPDGSKLATASNDSKAQLWDAKTGGLLFTLKHNTTVWSIAFDPNGTEVATGSGDGKVRLWDAKTGDLLATLNYSGNAYSVAFSPDGTMIAAAFTEFICIWDCNTHKLIGRCDVGSDSIRSLAFSPDGTKIATGSFDHTGRIWDIKNGYLLEVLQHDNTVSSVAFSPDGTRLATASYDKTARIWAVRSDNLICQVCQRLILNLTSNDSWERDCRTCSCTSVRGYRNEPDDLMKDCDRALELNESDSIAWLNKGNVLEYLGKHEKAAQAYDKAIELKPDYERAWNNKGLSLASQGKYNESITAYDEAIKLNQLDPIVWNNKGFALYNLGKHDESLKAYNRSIELNLNMADAWLNKANTLKNLSRYQEAIHAYDQVILFLDQNNAWAWLNEGICWDRLDMSDIAIRSYNQAVSIDPNNPGALNTSDCSKAWVFIGVALANQGKFNESINASNKSIELNPRYANAWVTRGLALFEMGKYNESIQDYDKAIELKPMLAPAWEFKGLALKSAGRTAESEAAFARAKVLGYNI